MDDITFGLEICLDHAMQRLADYTPTSGERLPQIHLIPSEGMNIMTDAICCGSRGLVFNVDGAYGMHGAQLQQDEGYVFDTWRRSAVLRMTGASTATAVGDVSSCENKLVGWRWVNTSHSKYFNHHGFLRAYQPQPIPPTRTAA